MRCGVSATNRPAVAPPSASARVLTWATPESRSWRTHTSIDDEVSGGSPTPTTRHCARRTLSPLPIVSRINYRAWASPTAGTEFPADTIALTHGLPRDSRSWTRAPASTEERISLYSDKVLTCADCSQDFVFTASEQEFYATRGFTEPRRCSACRASRKAARGATGGNTGFGERGGSSYGSRTGFG